MIGEIFFRRHLWLALLASEILLAVGLALHVKLWNHGWAIDLVDLFGIPLEVWFFWYLIFGRKK